MSKMKKLYQEIEETIIYEPNEIDLNRHKKLQEELGTEYTHIKNHIENNCKRYENIEEKEEKKDGE